MRLPRWFLSVMLNVGNLFKPDAEYWGMMVPDDVVGRVAVKAGLVRGWLWQPSRPNARLTAEISIDGETVGSVKANLLRDDLIRSRTGDGAHGFELRLGHIATPSPRISLALHAQISGKRHKVHEVDCSPLAFGPSLVSKVHLGQDGVSGWAWDRTQPNKRLPLQFRLADRVVGSCVADRARDDLPASGLGDGSHGFVFALSSITAPYAAGAKLTVLAEQKSEFVPIGQVTLTASGGHLPASEPASAAKMTGEEISAGIRRASELEAGGKLQEARDQLLAILPSAPTKVDVLFRLARVLRGLGDNAGAKRHALKVLSLKKNDPKACITLARIAESEGQRALAVEYWSRVPKSESAYRERLLKSARALTVLERPQEALATLEQAVRLWPNELSCRSPLAQLAADLGYDELAAEQNAAMQSLPQGNAAKHRGVIRDASRAEALMRRHASALYHLDDPVALGIGGSLLDCLLSTGLVNGLAEHFGGPIDVIVPEDAPFAGLVFAKSPAVRRLLTTAACETAYEVALLLPEFALAEGANRLRGSLRYEYTDTHALPAGPPRTRYAAYAGWIAEVVGGNSQPLVAPRVLLPSPGTARQRDGILLLETGAPGDWPGFSALEKLCRDRGLAASRLKIPEAMPGTDLEAAVKRIAAAGVVVTSDQAIALLAGTLGAPIVFVTAAIPGDLVADVVPDAAIVAGGAGCGPCAEQPENRWKSVVGACECLRALPAVSVMAAVEEKLQPSLQGADVAAE